MENKDIIVKNSGVIKLQSFDDFPDGNISIAEGKKSVPFEIKRVYFINNLFNKKSVRGKHAHKKLEQIIFCVNGRFTLDFDDGVNKQSIVLEDAHSGIRLGPMLWHEMRGFSNDCVILVLASDYYNEDDYIRNYDEFLKVVNNIK